MQALRRSTQVLQEISEHSGGLTLQQLVTRLGIPLASMHRLLGALGDEGLVVRSPATRRYVIGPTIHRLATGWKTRSDVADVARPHLERLRHDLSETAFVSQLVGDKVICVALAESTHRLRLFVRVGQEMPLHATAAARAILAYRRPPFARAALSARRLQAYNGRTQTDVQAIVRRLAHIREQGYDTCEDELDQGVWAVAAPIGGPAGEIDASVSVAGPAHRLADSATRLETIRAVQSAARAIDADLGVAPLSDADRLLAAGGS